MGYWWCTNCQVEIADSTVTVQGKHATCGHLVEWIEDRMTGLTFSEALERCRAGARITRKGWNGKGMFVYFQEGSLVDVANLRCAALKNWAENNSINKVLLHAHFDMKSADDTLVIGWLASQTDMLASDWRAE